MDCVAWRIFEPRAERNVRAERSVHAVRRHLERLRLPSGSSVSTNGRLRTVQSSTDRTRTERGVREAPLSVSRTNSNHKVDDAQGLSLWLAFAHQKKRALLMKCKFVACVNELPENARKGTLFCCDVCRAAEHRRMLAQCIETNQSNKVGATGSAADPETGPENEHKGHKRRRPQISAPSTSEMARVVRATPNPQDKARTRIPFDRQVRSQAPDGAAGYRLVLLMHTQTESPRIIPSAHTRGALRYCSGCSVDKP